MQPNKKTSSKCGDVLHKGSSFLSFISLLLIVALFLRMQSINKKTEMNERRILKVESLVETELLQPTDHKNEMETSESKYTTTLFYRYILQDSKSEVLVSAPMRVNFRSSTASYILSAKKPAPLIAHIGVFIYSHTVKGCKLTETACRPMS